MLTRRSHRFAAYLIAGVSSLILTATPAHAIYPVFDATSALNMIRQLAQQAQEIANQVEQIRNQVQSLENEARMLQDLDVSNYRDAVDAMRRIQTILRNHCIEIDAPTPNRIGYDSGFDCQELLERFRRTYPAPPDWADQSDDEIAEYPDQWNAQKRETAAKAMETQNVSVEAMEGTAERMAKLAAASENAPGQKAALQVTNEMLVTLSAQLRDQQATAIATQRAAAIEQAEEAAWYERNKELIRRVTHDSRTDYTLTAASSPFGRALQR